MLSDSNSTQDAFTDPTSSQDSSHKPASGKVSSASSESTTPVKEGQPAPEDTGMQAVMMKGFLTGLACRGEFYFSGK